MAARARQVRSAREEVTASVTERDLMAAVRAAAEWQGWKVYHVQYSMRSPAGWPDLVLARPPRLIFAELKSADGQLTVYQRRWLDVLAACDGAEVYVWTPAAWRSGEVDAILGREALGAGHPAAWRPPEPAERVGLAELGRPPRRARPPGRRLAARLAEPAELAGRRQRTPSEQGVSNERPPQY